MTRSLRTAFAEPEYRPEFLDDVQALSHPLNGCGDLDPLIDRIGDARFVLLGEASHGTAEYYEWRRRISQRLIRDKGFSFIAVEGDWPDCYRVNRYVKGRPDAGDSAQGVLRAFERWPTWMWANEEVVEMAEWLREHNASVTQEQKAGFYGLDVYSLWESMEAVLGYLIHSADEPSVEAARRAFDCFEPFGRDEHEYARATRWAPDSCEDEVMHLLSTLRRDGRKYEHDGREEFFNAEQNALVARNAERYYRTMVRRDAQSWNERDRHMVETLNRLAGFHGENCKAILWEHNTHIGDARYTDMSADGMINVGELVRRQRPANDVVLVGFSSYRGTVIAGDYWGAPMRKMPVPPGRPGSWEDVLHETLGADSLLLFDSGESDELLEPVDIAPSASCIGRISRRLETTCRRCCRGGMTRSPSLMRRMLCIRWACRLKSCTKCRRHLPLASNRKDLRGRLPGRGHVSPVLPTVSRLVRLMGV